MTPADSRIVADAINARNARLAGRADAAAGVVVAVVLAILGALALVHYLTPCEAGALCLAPIIRTRGALSWRDAVLLLRPLRRWYLRRLIVAAEFDAAWHDDAVVLSPILAANATKRATALRAELAKLMP